MSQPLQMRQELFRGIGAPKRADPHEIPLERVRSRRTLSIKVGYEEGRRILLCHGAAGGRSRVRLREKALLRANPPKGAEQARWKRGISGARPRFQTAATDDHACSQPVNWRAVIDYSDAGSTSEAGMFHERWHSYEGASGIATVPRS